MTYADRRWVYDRRAIDGWIGGGCLDPFDGGFVRRFFVVAERVRRLERQPARKSPSPADLERGIFDSVELSLEAMLEEMELKEREILNRLERREPRALGSLGPRWPGRW